MVKRKSVFSQRLQMFLNILIQNFEPNYSLHLISKLSRLFQLLWTSYSYIMLIFHIFCSFEKNFFYLGIFYLQLSPCFTETIKIWQFFPSLSTTRIVLTAQGDLFVFLNLKVNSPQEEFLRDVYAISVIVSRPTNSNRNFYSFCTSWGLIY